MKKTYFIVIIGAFLAMLFNLNCSSSKEGTIEEKQSAKTEIKTDAQIKASVTKAPRMHVKEEKYVFQEIEEGSNVVHEWEIKNIGTDTLYISDVESSCGCTVANLDIKVIAPNASTKLKATLNTTGRVGINTKFITIHSNDSAAPNKQLVLEGRVKPKGQTKSN